MPFILCHQIFCLFFFWLALLPSIECQLVDKVQGEGLKARLLANLNSYSGLGERAAEGPMESLGARTEAPSSAAPPPSSVPVSSVDPLSSLFALFRPSPVPPLMLSLSPFSVHPSICTPPSNIVRNSQQILPQDLPLSDRRYHQQRLPLPVSPFPFSTRLFPITSDDRQQKTKNNDGEKGGRRTAEVIGEWRRRMYKVLKTARAQRSREGKADNSVEIGNTTRGDADAEHDQHSHRLLLFGPPPAVIDARRAAKLGNRVFGVENTRNGTRGWDATMAPLRKNLHSFELRTKAGQKMPKTISRNIRTTMAPQKERWQNGEDEEENVYNEVIEEEEEEEQRERDEKEEREVKKERSGPKEQKDGRERAEEGEEEEEGTEQVEIVYLPALKTSSRKPLRAKATRGEEAEGWIARDRGGDNPQTKRRQQKSQQQEEEHGEDQASRSSSAVASAPLAQQSKHLTPIVPLLYLPSSPPSTLLPLQFPTLLPPIVPPLTVVPSPPPPAIQLSHLIAKPSLSAPPVLSQSADSDYLKELENVPEDYVDEQERRPNFVHLPCTSDRSASSSAALSAGCPLPQGVIPSKCQKIEIGPLPERKEQPTAKVLKTPSTGIFFEASPEEANGGTMRNLWDENRDKCNSARLRVLIQRSIVPFDAEKSKRRLQQQAEQQFGTFYNVICGTGFFSYIAHTDEFCLMAVHDMNCYVFSPVCSTQMALSSGISSQRERSKSARVFNTNRTKRGTRRRHF